jgi:SAM-dependent methyltransferase
MSEAVIWHDIECGGYRRDLPVWRRLAAEADGPVLDVGAGTGRTSLDLASRGVQVTALDVDAELLAALKERARAQGLEVATVCADARDFRLDERFALIIVPMQTLQLLGGAEGRRAFFECAVSHLEPGGRLAAAIVDKLETFDGSAYGLPEPDRDEVDGHVYTSTPLAVVDEGERTALHRLRRIDGGEPVRDVVHLDRVTVGGLEREGASVGLTPEPPITIPPTPEHVGSTVVMWHA